MKIAILLKGIFYMPYYPNKSRLIDFRECFPSLQQFFANHEVDFYISTYHSDLDQQILDTYKPVAHEFRDFAHVPVYAANNLSTLKIIELFKKHRGDKPYDVIILTRPDLKFVDNIKFENLPISAPANKNALTLMRLTKHRKGYYEDNFNIIGDNVIHEYEYIIKRHMKYSHHHVLKLYQSHYNKVVEYKLPNVIITPGYSGFYRLIKNHISPPS